MCVKSQWREMQTTDYLVIAIFFPESKKKKKKNHPSCDSKGAAGLLSVRLESMHN